jgi:hypothetical protein
VAKVLFVGCALTRTTVDGWQAMKSWGDGADGQPPFGVYQVEALTTDQSTAATRWRRVAMDNRGFQVLLEDDTIQSFRLVTDRVAGRLSLTDAERGQRVYLLGYQLAEGGAQVTLEGTLRDEPVAVRLRRLSSASFPLLRRGFHWVNEFPYNR